MGIDTIDRTTWMVDAMTGFMGSRSAAAHGIRAPTGSHPGGEDHETPGPGEVTAAEAPVSASQEA